MSKDISKRVYTTSLDAETISKFKIYCALKRRYQNEVLEELIVDLLEKENMEDDNANK